MLANAEGVCQAITATLPAAWNLVEVNYAATNFGSYSAAASPSIASFFLKPHKPDSANRVLESLPVAPSVARLQPGQTHGEGPSAGKSTSCRQASTADPSRLDDQHIPSLSQPAEVAHSEQHGRERHDSTSVEAHVDSGPPLRSSEADILRQPGPDGQVFGGAAATGQPANCQLPVHSSSSCSILPGFAKQQHLSIKRKCPGEASIRESDSEILESSMKPSLPSSQHCNDLHSNYVPEEHEASGLSHTDSRHNKDCHSPKSVSLQMLDSQSALQPCRCRRHLDAEAVQPATNCCDGWTHADVQQQRSILRDIELQRLTRLAGTQSNSEHAKGSQVGNQKRIKQTTLSVAKFFKPANIQQQ